MKFFSRPLTFSQGVSRMNFTVMFWGENDENQKNKKDEKKSYTGHCAECGKLTNFEWNGNHYQCTNWGCGAEVR